MRRLEAAILPMGTPTRTRPGELSRENRCATPPSLLAALAFFRSGSSFRRCVRSEGLPAPAHRREALRRAQTHTRRRLGLGGSPAPPSAAAPRPRSRRQGSHRWRAPCPRRGGTGCAASLCRPPTLQRRHSPQLWHIELAQRAAGTLGVRRRAGLGAAHLETSGLRAGQAACPPAQQATARRSPPPLAQRAAHSRQPHRPQGVGRAPSRAAPGRGLPARLRRARHQRVQAYAPRPRRARPVDLRVSHRPHR